MSFDLFGDNDEESLFAVSVKKTKPPIVIHSGKIQMSKFSSITNDFIRQNAVPIQLQIVDDTAHIKFGFETDPENDIICNFDIDWTIDDSYNAYVTQPNKTKWMISFGDPGLLVKYTYYAVKEKISRTEICQFSPKANTIFSKIRIIKYDANLNQVQMVEETIPKNGIIPTALHAFNGAAAFVKLGENEYAIVTPIAEQSTIDQKNESSLIAEKPKKPEQTVKESMSIKLNQIEALKKEFQSQFDNLLSELNSLQMEKISFDNITMSGEDILDGVSSLIEESENIEKKLQKITDDIDRVKYESQCQDAAIEAKQRVSSINVSLERKTIEYNELNKNLIDLEKKTEIAKEQLNKLKFDSKKTAKEIEDKMRVEIESNNNKLENEVKELEDRLAADKERLSMSESILSGLEEPTEDVDLTDLVYNDMKTILGKIMIELQGKEKITGSEIISLIKKAYSETPI